MGLSASPLSRCGGLVSATQVAWDSKSSTVAVASGRHVRVHDAGKGDEPILRRPRTFAVHDDDVVAVATLGPSRVLSASRDGTLRIWDTDDAVCLSAVDVGEAIVDIAAPYHECDEWDGYVAVACKVNTYLVLVAPERNRQSRRRVVLWSCGIEAVECNDSGSVIIGVSGSMFHVVERARVSPNRNPEMPEGRSGKGADEEPSRSSVQGDMADRRGAFHARQRISKLAVNADGSLVAVGDSSGSIHLYRDVLTHLGDHAGRGSKPSHCSSSRLHWHSSAVTALRFASDGAVLFSGGSEAVLVSWKVSHGSFGDRSFRPRLGGAIWGISPSPDSRRIALTCADNAVRILDAFNMNICTEIQGLAVPGDSLAGSSRSAVLQHVRKLSITPEPARNGCVLVTGVGGAVQVFDVLQGEHAGFFPVAPRNEVHVGSAKSSHGAVRPRNPVVRHARMSADGCSMATVDCQRSSETQQSALEDQEILRFWQRNPKTDSLDMVARVENPHGASGDVTSLEFHPSLPIVATASSSGTVKLWRLVHTGVKSRELTWRCEAERTQRGFSCAAVSFSRDGSLLAVGAGSTVALWGIVLVDSDASNKASPEGSVHESCPSSLRFDPLHTFVHPPSRERIVDVKFAQGEFPAVISTTKHGIYVWNVLAQCIWWSLRLVTTRQPISIDESLGRFAVSVEIPVSASRASAKSRAGEKKKDGKPDGRHVGRQAGVDRSLLLFDLASPVPVCVHRLPRGRRLLAASFISLPDHKGASPLVYVDGHLEMHTIDDEDSKLALAESEKMHTEKYTSDESQHRLDALLGSDWRSSESPDNAGWTKPPSEEHVADGGAVSAGLESIFAGPTHALAPLSSTASDAIGELLRVGSLSVSGKIARHKAEGEEDVAQVGDDGETSDNPIKSSPPRPPSLTSGSGREARLKRYAALAAGLEIVK